MRRAKLATLLFILAAIPYPAWYYANWYGAGLVDADKLAEFGMQDDFVYCRKWRPAEFDLMTLYKAKVQGGLSEKMVFCKRIDVSETVKVLWYEWEYGWWGGLDAFEVDDDGRIKQFFHIDEPPQGQTNSSVKAFRINKKDYLEVITCTHMGNAFLHLYEIMEDNLLLRVQARVGINGNYGEFDPVFAKVTYEDLNADRKTDIKIFCRYKLYDEFDETVILKEGDYRRIFHYNDEQYDEDISQRSGHNRFLD